jgi:hypothetical protein
LPHGDLSRGFPKANPRKDGLDTHIWSGSKLAWSAQLETNFLLHVYLTYTGFISVFQSTRKITRILIYLHWYMSYWNNNP